MSEGANAKARRRRNALIVRGGIAIVVIAAIVGLYLILRNTSLPVIGRSTCESKELIAEFNTAFSDKGNKDKAQAVAKKISQISDKNQNATCTYMLVRYEKTYGSAAEAKKQLTTLRELESAKKTINKDVNDGVNKAELYEAIDRENEPYTPKEGGPQRVEG